MIRFWRNYELSKAAALMFDAGWWLRCHVLVVGPFAFAVIWKCRQPKSET